jgi:hypothetical protein
MIQSMRGQLCLGRMLFGIKSLVMIQTVLTRMRIIIVVMKTLMRGLEMMKM